MSTDSPQESPEPTPARRRVGLPAISRIAAAIALALLALAVGGAGLGLAIASRLSGEDSGPVAYYSQVDVVRGGERFGPAPGAKRGFDRGRSRVGRSPFTKDSWDCIAAGSRGTGVIHGEVVARDADSVLIETSNGERRRVQGVPRAGGDLDVGSTVTLDVRSDAQGRLRYAGKHGARSPARADADVRAGVVIAIGEVTRVSDDTVSVATILGNHVDIALQEAGQADGVAVGGSVVVMAERAAGGLVARWVRPISPPGEFGDRAWLRPAVAS